MINDELMLMLVLVMAESQRGKGADRKTDNETTDARDHREHGARSGEMKTVCDKTRFYFFDRDWPSASVTRTEVRRSEVRGT